LLYFNLWFYDEKGKYISIYGSAYYLRTVSGKTAKVRMEGVFMLQIMERDGEEWRTIEIGRGSILFQDKD